MEAPPFPEILLDCLKEYPEQFRGGKYSETQHKKVNKYCLFLSDALHPPLLS